MLTEEQRRNGVGASEIGAICGLSPYSTADEVERIKLGLSPGPERTWSMRWGQLAEPGILQELREDFGWSIEHNQRTFFHGREDWAFATPDGIATIGPETVLVQCKASPRKRDDRWGADGGPDAPAYVVAQVLWEMWVMRSNGYDVGRSIIAARFGTRQTQQFHIPYDDGRAIWLAEQGRAFWRRVQSRRRELEAA